MTEHDSKRLPQFYITTPQPCPYLAGLYERKVFTHLLNNSPIELNDMLSQSGFRRSQNIAYRPACDGCNACVSVRIVAADFKPEGSFRRVLQRNEDVRATMRPAQATSEQFSLLRGYLDERHWDGGMADMTMLDYQSMVEDTTIRTSIIEYRVPKTEDGTVVGRSSQGRLIAAALTDMLSDGLSMVYSFYEPDETQRSLGTYMILDHVRRALALGLPYVYLGYWVDGSKKMAYKARFKPLEALGPEGWQLLEK
ncbi:MAG: arginyltransferase [Parvibaculaceae bacterium]|nr:arginyltransferase [Parvibaculaceae bacterium]